MKIKWLCPYCSTENEVWDPSTKEKIVRSDLRISFVLTCDQEEAGCGRRSAVDFHTFIQSVSHKIEGERPEEKQ